MTAAFLFSVVVQFNDPDPARWILIYGLACVACLLAIAGRIHWVFSTAVGIMALTWALTLASNVLGKVAFKELFEAFEMKDERVEVAREFGGLLIVAFWMAALTVSSLRKKKV